VEFVFHEHVESLHRIHHGICHEKHHHFFGLGNRLLRSCDSNALIINSHSSSVVINLNFGMTTTLKLSDHFSTTANDFANRSGRDCNDFSLGLTKRQICLIDVFVA